MDDGKNEFYNLIVYLNKNKIDLTKTLGTYLSDLIKKWNNKNKTIRDYFEIKDIHPNIANYFLSSSNQELKQLWITYIAKFMEFRINIVANKYYEHKNINLEKAKQYLDDKNIKYTIHNNEFTNEPVITINENATITILESNDWNEIKRHIDSKINMQIKYSYHPFWTWFNFITVIVLFFIPITFLLIKIKTLLTNTIIQPIKHFNTLHIAKKIYNF